MQRYTYNYIAAWEGSNWYKGKYVFLVLLSSCFEKNFKQILPDGFYGIPEVPPCHRFFTNKNRNIVSCHNILIIKYKNKLLYSKHWILLDRHHFTRPVTNLIGIIISIIFSSKKSKGSTICSIYLQFCKKS